MSCILFLTYKFQSIFNLAIHCRDGKQYQCQNIVLITKLDYYFWNSIDAKKTF